MYLFFIINNKIMSMVNIYIYLDIYINIFLYVYLFRYEKKEKKILQLIY